MLIFLSMVIVTGNHWFFIYVTDYSKLAFSLIGALRDVLFNHQSTLLLKSFFIGRS